MENTKKAERAVTMSEVVGEEDVLKVKGKSVGMVIPNDLEHQIAQEDKKKKDNDKDEI